MCALVRVSARVCGLSEFVDISGAAQAAEFCYRDEMREGIKEAAPRSTSDEKRSLDWAPILTAGPRTRPAAIALLVSAWSQEPVREVLLFSLSRQRRR